MQTCAVIVVASLEWAEETLLAGDMPCPRCQGVLRPFGTGRTRTVRGVGADTVTVTPRPGPQQRLLATRVLLPAELMVRRADSTEVIGNVLVAKSRGAGYGKHRRPLRASRVDRPPIVAGRARAARAVALPPQRRPCGPGRPGVAGPAGGRSPTLFWLQPGQAAGCWLVATV